MLADTSTSLDMFSGGIVTVHLDSLAAAEAEMLADAVLAPARRPAPAAPATSFATKSLDDEEEPQVSLRLDAPHAFGRHRPHVRFSQPEPEKTATEIIEQQPAAELATNELDELKLASPVTPTIAADLPPATLPVDSELTIAESLDQTLDEPLASDLVPLGDATLPDFIVAEAVVTEPAPAAKPTVPLWEVDRFHWPRTCEKLFADSNGYLARRATSLWPPYRMV